jgi:predicted nucleotidyltransferase
MATEPAVKYASYIEGLVARERRQRLARCQRAIRAREAAQRVADLLRKEYNITYARLFGSALAAERFHERSDVDLAIEGLRPEL